jgi:hypothetical protein
MKNGGFLRHSMYGSAERPSVSAARVGRAVLANALFECPLVYVDRLEDYFSDAHKPALVLELVLAVEICYGEH